jgi:anti-anti-sigma factor
MEILQVIPMDEPGSFRLVGELDLASAERLEPILKEAAEANGGVTLDLTELTFMDSTGIRVILSTVRSLDGQGPLVLLRPSYIVRRVLDVSLPDGMPGLEIRD